MCVLERRVSSVLLPAFEPMVMVQASFDRCGVSHARNLQNKDGCGRRSHGGRGSWLGSVVQLPRGVRRSSRGQGRQGDDWNVMTGPRRTGCRDVLPWRLVDGGASGVQCDREEAGSWIPPTDRQKGAALGCYGVGQWMWGRKRKVADGNGGPEETLPPKEEWEREERNRKKPSPP